MCIDCTAGYLEYLESSGRYRTQLLKAKYEYEQAWNPDWEPNKEDAMSVSVCSGDSSSPEQQGGGSGRRESL